MIIFQLKAMQPLQINNFSINEANEILPSYRYTPASDCNVSQPNQQKISPSIRRTGCVYSDILLVGKEAGGQEQTQ